MTKKSIRSVFISILLAVFLIGVMIAYFSVVSTLPRQIYTDRQQAYLAYNDSRSVAQKAPILNVIPTQDQAISAVLPVQDSRVRATLAARYEEQEGVSVTVYDLDFRGEYQLTHADPETATIELFFPFPGNLETLHEVIFLVDGVEPDTVEFSTQGIRWQTVLEPEAAHDIWISYKADGANSFTYGLPQNQRANVDIRVVVLDLYGSEVPQESLPATLSETGDDAETFTWHYTGLIADRDIHLTLPTQLSFAQRVAELQADFLALAGLAPFLIGLFLLLLWGLFRLSNIHLRAESYLLIGCGLVLFYPLLTFLSGMFNVKLAAVLAFLLISGLLLTFLGLAIGWRKSWWRLGLLLTVFLGMFSLGLLTPWHGLLLTGGGLLLVAAFMLLFARRATKPEPEENLDPMPVETNTPEFIPPAEPNQVDMPEPASPSEPVAVMAEKEITPEQHRPHCPQCGRTLAEDDNFCSGCGHDTQPLHRCESCGHEQWLPDDGAPHFCINCGRQL